jgi:large repetitive protein
MPKQTVHFIIRYLTAALLVWLAVSPQPARAAELLADLNIRVMGLSEQAVAGDQFQYSITVLNQGTTAASGVTFTSLIPAGTQYVAITNSANCSLVNSLLTCAHPTPVAVSQSIVYNLTVLVNPGTRGNLVNTVTVTSLITDPDPGDNQASAVTPVIADVNLGVVHQMVMPSIAIAGASLTYTLAASNAGLSTATGVVVTDDLPAEIESLISISPECSGNADVVTCNLGALGPSEYKVITLQVKVRSNATAPLFNYATIGGVEADGNPSNNSTARTTNLVTRTDLDIQLLDEPDPATAGAGLTYRYVATNLGPSDATGVEIDGTLPQAINLQTFTATQGTCTWQGLAFSCNLGNIAAGATVIATATAIVDSATTASLHTSAEIDGNEVDLALDNNETQATTGVVTSADLVADLSASHASILAGLPLTYTLSVQNIGPSDATTVTLKHILPDGVTVEEISAANCSQAAGEILCNYNRLVPGQEEIVRVRVKVAPAWRTALTSELQATSLVPDPAAENSSDNLTTPVAAESGLSVYQSVAPDQPVAGLPVTYTLTVANGGPSQANNLVLSDVLPAGVSLVSAPGCTPDKTDFTCPLGSIEPKGMLNVTFVAMLSPSLRGSITNTAAVNGIEEDPDASDNQSSLNSQVVGMVELAVNVDPSAEKVRPGEPLTFTVTVQNSGPSDASGIILTTTLPDNLNVIAMDPALCQITDRTLTCQVGVLKAGHQIPLTLQVQFEAQITTTLPLQLAASFFVAAVETDLHAANNRDEQIVTVEAYRTFLPLIRNTNKTD